MRSLRHSARWVAGLAAAASLATVVGCQQEPNYRLRWTIEGRGAPTVTACAESGMFEVRARAFSEPNRVVEEIVLSCAQASLADPNGSVGGTSLPPGRYGIELRGIDRAGNTWDDPSQQPLEPDEIHNGCNAINDYTECRPTELVCDCLELEVAEEDSLVTLPEFVLTPPPECIDGIDNDNDGLVDARDPACVVDGGIGGEGLPVGLTELRISLSFLSQNPNATCNSVQATDFQVRVDSGDGPQVVLEDVCTTERPYLLSLRLPAGSYEVSAVAINPPAGCSSVDRECEQLGLTASQCVTNNPSCFAETCEASLADCDGQGLSEAECEQQNPECFVSGLLTTPSSFDAEITPVGGSLVETLDFAAEDFLTPIVGRIRVSPLFVSTLGLDGGSPVAAREQCGSTSTPGTLDVANLHFEMLNAHGGPVDEPVILDGAPIDNGPRPCASMNLTEPVTWGGYALRLSGSTADGTVCFEPAAELTQLRPDEAQSIPMKRVYEAPNVVPEGCSECEADSDCGDVGGIACLAGVCQFPCDDDVDCRSAAVGDLGFTCQTVEGRSANYCRQTE